MSLTNWIAIWDFPQLWTDPKCHCYQSCTLKKTEITCHKLLFADNLHWYELKAGSGARETCHLLSASDCRLCLLQADRVVLPHGWRRGDDYHRCRTESQCALQHISDQKRDSTTLGSMRSSAVIYSLPSAPSMHVHAHIHSPTHCRTERIAEHFSLELLG